MQIYLWFINVLLFYAVLIYNINVKQKIRPLARTDFRLEAPPGFEPGHKGFAGLCLTTWLWCRIFYFVF